MSKLFDKFLTKMLAVIVIIVFIIGFREMILTDDDTATAFGALHGHAALCRGRDGCNLQNPAVSIRDPGNQHGIGMDRSDPAGADGLPAAYHRRIAYCHVSPPAGGDGQLRAGSY